MTIVNYDTPPQWVVSIYAYDKVEGLFYFITWGYPRCSLPTNRAMRKPFYGGIELLWMAPRSF